MYKSMYKRDLTGCVAVLFFSAVLFFALKISVTENFISGSITYIAIVLGFYAASFSSLFASEEIKGLYKIEDAEDRRLTLLHRIENYYRTGFFFSVLTIFLLLLSSLNIQRFSLNSTLALFVFPFVITNTFIFWRIFTLFCRLFTSRLKR